MKNVFLFLGILPGILFAESQEFTLVENGVSVAEIQIPARGLDAFGGRHFFDMRTEEFNRTLKAISGTELPVVKSPSGKSIRWNLVMKPKSGDNQSFSISFPDEKTMLVTLHGPVFHRVYNYLIKTVSDAEYLSPEKCGLDATEKKTLSIPMQDTHFPPPSFSLGRVAWVLPEVRYQWDMAYSSIYYTHDQPRFVFPVEKYKNGYPPAVMPVLNGKKIDAPPVKNRPDAWWQPCYGSEECAAIAAANILEYLKKNPWIKCVGLGVNDLGGFCECDLCRKINGNRPPSDQSNVYYTWVNRIAEEVCKTCPDMRFGLIAYRETHQPPDFKLHPNVVPVLTFDLFSCIDDEVRAEHEKTIRTWSDRASSIGVWDYAWGSRYWIPRVAFLRCADMLKFLHKHNCRFYFAENEFVTIADGPKTFLVKELLQNIEADPNAVLDDWFRRCAGEKGAVHLKRYYERCENFYGSDAVRKTPWFSSVRSVYMTMKDPSWMNALSSEVLDAMAHDLDSALAEAETSDQKERVREIKRHFDFARIKARISGAEYCGPDGTIATREDALAMIGSFRQIAPVIRAGQDIVKVWVDGEFGDLYKRYIFSEGFDGEQETLAALTKILPFVEDPEVQAALLALAEDETVPQILSRTAKTLASLNQKCSLIPNSSFELPLDSASGFPPESRIFQRSTKNPRSGNYSLRFLPGRIHGLSFYAKAEEGKTYLVIARIFTPEANPEAFADMAAWAQIRRQNLQWRNMAKIPIPPRVWTDLAAIVSVPVGKKSDEVRIYFEFGNFNPGQELFIDDVIMLEL